MAKSVTIKNDAGDAITVPLSLEGGRDVGKLTIDGVSYHVERIKAAMLKRDYRVDKDTVYSPQHDRNGMCVIIAPYSKK